MCSDTEAPPALCPNSVTWLGSPPKYCIFLLTHFRAISWSKSPWLPLVTASSVDKNPFDGKLQYKVKYIDRLSSKATVMLPKANRLKITVWLEGMTKCNLS